MRKSIHIAHVSYQEHLALKKLIQCSYNIPILQQTKKYSKWNKIKTNALVSLIDIYLKERTNC